MKKFLKIVLEIKANACIMFTAAVIVFLIISLFTGIKSIETKFLFQGLITVFIGAIIQCVCYSDTIIKKMRSFTRGILFVGVYLPILSLFAILFKWFPTNSIGIWISFLASFFLIFAGISVGFAILYKVTGKKYTEGVLAYQQKNNNEK